MATVDQLVHYFSNGIRPVTGIRIGSEIETFFVNADGSAITLLQSQEIFARLIAQGWEAGAQKGSLLTELRKGGHKILYELGFPNIELAVAPHQREEIIPACHGLLNELYDAARYTGAQPVFEPIFDGDGNYLAIPDERDATWLQLDGKKALSPLARISAVQFTFDVSEDEAMRVINNLGDARAQFLARYPQDDVWREYIRTSEAGYRDSRYGYPGYFWSFRKYCEELARHDVVSGSHLVGFEEADLLDPEQISLFIRSIWWYFRLRRYGAHLCVEVRPLPRLSDGDLQSQLDLTMGIAFPS